MEGPGQTVPGPGLFRDSVPLQPARPGARCPHCHWSCSHSPSRRSCRSQWCSRTPHCWNVLRLPALAGRCKTSGNKVRRPAKASSALCSLPLLLPEGRASATPNQRGRGAHCGLYSSETLDQSPAAHGSHLQDVAPEHVRDLLTRAWAVSLNTILLE